MGTRHLQTVIDKNGVKRIEQYGQWDGYPEGQGIDILRFLKSADLNQYAKNVSKIKQITPKQVKMVGGCKDWKIKYPYMSRDCGADIHQMILDNKVEFVHLHDEATKRYGCEWFYTIDLQKNTFTVEYHSIFKVFGLSELPNEEQFIEMTKETEWV